MMKSLCCIIGRDRGISILRIMMMRSEEKDGGGGGVLESNVMQMGWVVRERGKFEVSK